MLRCQVSRLAGHPNAGRGPASGYMDESAKNSAALREAAEPIIKALLFRGHYGEQVPRGGALLPGTSMCCPYVLVVRLGCCAGSA